MHSLPPLALNKKQNKKEKEFKRQHGLQREETTVKQTCDFSPLSGFVVVKWLALS